MVCSARPSSPARVPTTPNCRWPGWSTTSATASGPTRTTGAWAPNRSGPCSATGWRAWSRRTSPPSVISSPPTAPTGRSLSSDSVRTLALQGGALGTDELASFLSSPYAADAVALRRADDAAKVPGAPVATLDAWVPVLRAVAARSGAVPPSGAQPAGAQPT